MVAIFYLTVLNFASMNHSVAVKPVLIPCFGKQHGVCAISQEYTVDVRWNFSRDDLPCVIGEFSLNWCKVSFMKFLFGWIMSHAKIQEHLERVEEHTQTYKVSGI